MDGSTSRNLLLQPTSIANKWFSVYNNHNCGTIHKTSDILAHMYTGYHMIWYQ